METALMSPDELAKEIGSRVRNERLRLDWTQQTLAERAGLSRWTVTRLEAGEAVSLHNFLAIVVALRRAGDLDELLRPAPAQTIEQFIGSTTPTRRRGRK